MPAPQSQTGLRAPTSQWEGRGFNQSVVSKQTTQPSMTMIDQHLLSVLADGRDHPDHELCRALGTDTDSLRIHIDTLRALGIEINGNPIDNNSNPSPTGTSYRLARPWELLDADRIRDAMDPAARALLGELDVKLHTDSTNALLRRSVDASSPNGSACLSETQSAGRGRHGRAWVSPPGGNIYLSVAWHYPATVRDLSGLSLALGVAASHAIADIGATDIGLKWPNDLVWNDLKLGGILVELRSRRQQGNQVIAGIGINTRLAANQAVTIDQPWTDLSRIIGHPPPRNRLAGRLLRHFLDTLSGFGGSAPEWQREFARRDALASRTVTLTQPDGSVLQGVARGIDSQGALKMETERGISHHPVGEASIRPGSDFDPVRDAALYPGPDHNPKHNPKRKEPR